mgnify:CR=1 FL=1
MTEPGKRTRAYGRRRNRRYIAVLLAVGFSLISRFEPAVAQSRFASDSSGGLKINGEYSYYDVRGSTVEDIYRSLVENGPRNRGEAFYALTGVETGYRYRHVEEDATCGLVEVGVEANIMMRLPKWRDSEGASPVVREAWEVFLENLMRHEAHHYRIMEDAARRTYNTLLDMKAHSCSVLDTQASLAIQAISDWQVEENRRFDRDTEHGADEGAVWPPHTLADAGD